MAESLPTHVQWLVQNRGHELVAAIGEQTGGLDAEATLRILMAADPSPSKRAIQWLFDTLVRDGYRWEDISGGQDSKVRETLAWFSQHRAKLAPELRNLEAYSCLSAVYGAISRYVRQDKSAQGQMPQPGRELRRQERGRALASSLVIYRSAELIVAVPLSVEASQWWGRGTRWCTAALKSNAFAAYNRDAPLIVAVLPGIPSNPGIAGGKLQLYINLHGGGDFMDAGDHPVSPHFVQQHWSCLQPLVSWALERWPGMLAHVPHAKRTADMCRSAVERDGNLLALVPQELVDSDMCGIAISNCGRAIKHVPQHLYDKDLAMRAVARDPQAFSVIPSRLRSRELCLQAVLSDPAIVAQIDQRDARLCAALVRANPQALVHIKDEHKTAHMCTVAMQADPSLLSDVPISMRTASMYSKAVAHSGNMLELVPAHLRTSRLCTCALQTNAQALRMVPQHVLTEAMCMMATTRDGRMLERVPDNMRSHTVCLAAVVQNAASIHHVPHSVIDDTIAMTVVEADWRYLQQVPQQNRSARVCKSAVSRHGSCLQLVPMHLRSRELCKLAFHHPPEVSYRMVLPHVPAGLQDEDMYRSAVTANPLELEHVPAEHRSLELCMLALQAASVVVRFVPRDLLTPQLCREVVKSNPHALAGIEADKRSAELCAMAVEMDAMTLADVPQEHKTKELCTQACMRDRTALHYVPPHMQDSILETLPPIHQDLSSRFETRWQPETALDGLANALQGQGGLPQFLDDTNDNYAHMPVIG